MIGTYLLLDKTHLDMKLEQAAVAICSALHDSNFAAGSEQMYDIFMDQGAIIIYISCDPGRVIRHALPAASPKLHYTTWWRSLARRMYCSHID